jgi:hypothetical protein
MKMRLIAMTALIAAVTITACKKSSKTEEADETTVSQQLTQHADDQSRVSNDLDAVDNDINVAVESTPTFGRLAHVQQVMQLPCDATVTFDSTATDRRMIITFTGSACDSFRTRTGTITIAMPRTQHWRDSGATLSETIANLKITRRSDNKSITINGSRTVKNVTGGRVATIQPGTAVVHTIDGAMSITFDDNTVRQWNVARKRTFTRPVNNITMSISGTHTDNGITGIAEWGTTRYGVAFATQIAEPLKFNQECQFRLGSGKVVHTRLAHSLEVTYGLNAQGVPTGCPGANPYYYKAVWTGANGISQTVIRPYY